jgi:hypothetical protein
MVKKSKPILKEELLEIPLNWGVHKPMNFTEMPATCVCGKSLTLTLQNPSYAQISWGCFCTSCRWRVTVSLTR